MEKQNYVPIDELIECQSREKKLLWKFESSGKRLRLCGGTEGSQSERLEQLNSMREALFAQDGWGCENVNQDIPWEVPETHEPGSALWKILTTNTGTELWEVNLRNGGQPLSQPAAEPIPSWTDHMPSRNIGGTWGVEDDGGDSSSNAWNANQTQPPAPAWNQEPKKENDWSAGSGRVDTRMMNANEQRGAPKEPEMSRPGWNDVSRQLSNNAASVDPNWRTPQDPRNNFGRSPITPNPPGPGFPQNRFPAAPVKQDAAPFNSWDEPHKPKWDEKPNLAAGSPWSENSNQNSLWNKPKPSWPEMSNEFQQPNANQPPFPINRYPGQQNMNLQSSSLQMQANKQQFAMPPSPAFPPQAAASQNNNNNAAGQPSAHQLRNLVQKIQKAVQSGYLNQQILNQPLAPPTLQLLNTLLSCIQQLEYTQQGIQHSNGSNVSQLQMAIQKQKQQISQLQYQISQQQSMYIKSQGGIGRQNSHNDLNASFENRLAGLDLNPDQGFPAAKTSQQSRLNQWRSPPTLDDKVEDLIGFSRAPGSLKQSQAPIWPDSTSIPSNDFADFVPEFQPGKPWKVN
jgi:hypothetical protein